TMARSGESHDDGRIGGVLGFRAPASRGANDAEYSYLRIFELRLNDGFCGIEIRGRNADIARGPLERVGAELDPDIFGRRIALVFDRMRFGCPMREPDRAGFHTPAVD